MKHNNLSYLNSISHDHCHCTIELHTFTSVDTGNIDFAKLSFSNGLLLELHSPVQ